jgi:N-acyl-D-amino-acid deacylase
MLDLLIRGGLVIDGTGNPGFYAAVGVYTNACTSCAGRRAAIEAGRVIDATGRIVCPGFIDMHAHSGLVILAEPRHEPKVRQGITTELIGVDGNSYAPFHSHDDFLKFVQINSGLDGNPPLPGAGPRSSSTSTCSRSAWRSTSSTLSATRRSGSARWAGTTVPPRAMSSPT